MAAVSPTALGQLAVGECHVQAMGTGALATSQVGVQGMLPDAW